MIRPLRLVVAVAAACCVIFTAVRVSLAEDPRPTRSDPTDAAQPAKAERPAAEALGKADPQMKAVLDQLQALNPRPVEKLSAQDARKEPSATDAVMALMKAKGMPATPEPVGNVETRNVTGPNGNPQLRVRVYSPKGDGPFPVVVYYRGGGWVIATLDTYDASCRALCNLAGAVVISVDYRVAPENPYPAAHEDAYAALQWAAKSAAEVKGDPKRVAVAGESAGGNMAASVCLLAKDRNGAMPVHQLLIYPLTQVGKLETESIQANANAKPLNKAMLPWFGEKYFKSKGDATQKYATLLNATDADLKGLPAATVITAQIDPLMTEGKMYADKLKAAGVDVTYKNYDGVTHEFFGMGAVVDKAKQAEQFAADQLKAAFAK